MLKKYRAFSALDMGSNKFWVLLLTTDSRMRLCGPQSSGGYE